MSDPATPLAPTEGTLHSRVHLPALDGLRGIAILCVLAMHFAILKPLTAADRFVYGLARDGWIGVDLFFVLSGFLITGILLDSRGKEGAARSFYARRFLRIFPLYYGLLLVVFGLDGWLFSDATWLAGLQGDQGWHWAYLTNVLAARVGWAALPGIGHLWSLAIEEQFYLVWPFAVLLLARRRLVPLCLAMLALSLVARTVMVLRGVSPVAIFALTFTRWDGLAVGALVAIIGRQRGGMDRLARWSGPMLLMGSLASVGFLAAAPYRSHYGVGMQTTGYAVLALTFGALLVQAIRAPATSRLHRALADRRLAFFGRYSYGIYVLHGPLLGVLAALDVTPQLLPSLWGSALPGQALFAAIALAVTVAAALLSWALWERPFLSLKRYFPAANLRIAASAESAGRDAARAAA